MDAAEHALEVGQLLRHAVKGDRKVGIAEEVFDGIEAASTDCMSMILSADVSKSRTGR